MNFRKIFKIATAVFSACQEAKDEFLAARDPDSPGGKKITKEEFRVIAEEVWEKGLKETVIEILTDL